MAGEQKVYHRRISGEEAQGQYILVQKSALNLFPKIGRSFKLTVKGKDQPKEQKTFNVAVNAVACWCRGPKKPHSHYRIDVRDFREFFPIHFGKKIIITKNSDNKYTLS